jgi:hypothetical protein
MATFSDDAFLTDPNVVLNIRMDASMSSLGTGMRPRKADAAKTGHARQEWLARYNDEYGRANDMDATTGHPPARRAALEAPARRAALEAPPRHAALEAPSPLQTRLDRYEERLVRRDEASKAYEKWIPVDQLGRIGKVPFHLDVYNTSPDVFEASMSLVIILEPRARQDQNIYQIDFAPLVQKKLEELNIPHDVMCIEPIERIDASLDEPVQVFFDTAHHDHFEHMPVLLRLRSVDGATQVESTALKCNSYSASGHNERTRFSRDIAAVRGRAIEDMANIWAGHEATIPGADGECLRHLVNDRAVSVMYTVSPKAGSVPVTVVNVTLGEYNGHPIMSKPDRHKLGDAFKRWSSVAHIRVAQPDLSDADADFSDDSTHHYTLVIFDHVGLPAAERLRINSVKKYPMYSVACPPPAKNVCGTHFLDVKTSNNGGAPRSTKIELKLFIRAIGRNVQLAERRLEQMEDAAAEPSGSDGELDGPRIEAVDDLADSIDQLNVDTHPTRQLTRYN